MQATRIYCPECPSLDSPKLERFELPLRDDTDHFLTCPACGVWWSVAPLYATIDLATRNGSKATLAQLSPCGLLAQHCTADAEFAVSHVPTGLRIATFHTHEESEAFTRSAATWDWHFDDTTSPKLVTLASLVEAVASAVALAADLRVAS